MSVIGSALTGESKIERTLFLLGQSARGKSLLMQSLHGGFSDVYVKEFCGDTLSKTNPNRNKILNAFLASITEC